MPLIRIFGRGIRIPDLDRLFCYDTPKLLRIIDFKPGVIYIAGCVFVILYCFGFALVINQMYLEHTDAVGVAMVSLSQSMEDTVIKSEVMGGEGFENLNMPGSVDSYDLVYPPTEVGGIFITTHTASTVGQVMKPCPDRDSTFPACKTKKPIYSGLKYPSTTHCMEYTWCPKFGQGGASSTSELLDGTELNNVALDFKLFINWFPNDDPDTIKSQTMQMTLKEVLAAAGIQDIETVAETGCIVYLKFSFGTHEESCSTAKDCKPTLKGVRLDKNSGGFKYQRTRYYRNATTTQKEVRDVSEVHGIRIVATASGHGVTFSISASILQIASALAMWQLVYFAADIFTVYLNFNFLAYRRFKYVETPDFGDLKEQVEAKKIDAQAGKKTKRPRRNRARVKASGEEEEDE